MALETFYTGEEELNSDVGLTLVQDRAAPTAVYIFQSHLFLDLDDKPGRCMCHNLSSSRASRRPKRT